MQACTAALTCYRSPQGKRIQWVLHRENIFLCLFMGQGLRCPSRVTQGIQVVSRCSQTRSHLYSQKLVSCVNTCQSSSLSDHLVCISFFLPVYFCQYCAESFSVLSLLSKSFIYHFGSMSSLGAATSLSSNNSNYG